MGGGVHDALRVLVITIIRIFLKSEAPKALYSSHSFIVSALIRTVDQVVSLFLFNHI